MKAIFISYNQAFGDEVTDMLEAQGQRGYTLWSDIQGRGGIDGEPHLGNHAWPTQNHAILTASGQPCLAHDELRRAGRRPRRPGSRHPGRSGPDGPGVA